MSTISITLPKKLQKYVTAQVTELGLTAPEEYFEKLVREEQQKEELWAYYEKEVGKAIDEDRWTPINEEFWDRVHQKAKSLQKTHQKESVG